MTFFDTIDAWPKNGPNFSEQNKSWRRRDSRIFKPIEKKEEKTFLAVTKRGCRQNKNQSCFDLERKHDPEVGVSLPVLGKMFSTKFCHPARKSFDLHLMRWAWNCIAGREKKL
jgi:hypothetical protein